MLTQLMCLLAEEENGLSLSEISRAMRAQPSAVYAMLETLARKGRVIGIGPDGGYCSACGEQANCSLLAARGKRYTLIPVPGRELPGTGRNQGRSSR